MYSNIIILIISICIIYGYSRFSKAKLRKIEQKLEKENDKKFENEKQKLYNREVESFEKTLQLKQEELQENYKQREKEATELYNKNIEIVSLRIKNLQDKERDLKKQKELLENLLKTKQSEFDKELEKYKEVELIITKEKIKDEEIALRKEMEEEFSKDRADALLKFEEEMSTLVARKASVEDECKKIESELKDYKEKQKAINEAILRQRAIDEEQDFYRINLSENTNHDVKILNSIKDELINTNEIDKLIYSIYYSKPSMEMIKRVLEGRAPCGIYKITRLKTGEIYIGKSTDIKSRWQQHIKTSCNCGNIAHSQLHTTMQKDGIENFTFELVEEVSKDKLSEREKYWINFYDSKKYGLNEKNG